MTGIRDAAAVIGTDCTDLWSLCQQRSDDHPDRAVLDFDGGLWTWAELIDAAEALAGGLAAAGVAPGEVVCHMSPNHPEAVVTMLALLRLGAVECPVNAGLRGHVSWPTYWPTRAHGC